VLKWLANIFLLSSTNSSPKGFKGAQILACIILLQVAGGDSIDDLDLLRNDPGFTKLMNKMLISHHRFHHQALFIVG
jgi:hypothetical protein